MKLDRGTYKALKQILLGLPAWSDEEKRRVFVKEALWGHSILDQIVWKENADTAASNLIETCAGSGLLTQDGKTPLCALLAEVHDRGWAGGERAETVAGLEQALGCTGRKPAWSRDPYPGLMAFGRSDAPIFFGRRAETRDLLRRLATKQGRRFVLVTGASGSGKSSLVRAGVWARLEEGGVPDLPGSQDWLITAMFPSAQGGDPFLALTNSLAGDRRFDWIYPASRAADLRADAGAFAELLDQVLDALPSGAEWLLILDQMEELFTPAAEALREPFLEMILDAVGLPGFRVIATVRSDFLHRCVEHAGLREVINQGGQYSVGLPGAMALSRMITGPVQEVDIGRAIAVEERLVERMVEDALSEPGGLALLAFTLKEVYRQCKDNGRMGLDTYCDPDFDGLKGVIGRHADAALARTDREAQAALPKVFSRLVTVRKDGTATRRRERVDYWLDNPAARDLIAHLSDAATDRPSEEKSRLLVVTGTDAESTVEVAHEALLREWATLAGWIEEVSDALRLREQLETEAQTWNAAGRPEHLRWRHERLAPARALLAEADLLGELERDPVSRNFVVPEAEWLLAQLQDGGTGHDRREDIGLRLAEIGDPRPGVGVIDGVPDILWCAIPEGEFGTEGHSYCWFCRFQMAAYPVTHAQFQAFIDADDGFDAGDWWEDLRKMDPVAGRIRRHGNYPATHVSWYDATAFCRWLTHRVGFEVCLPDKWHWQWAAQSARRDFVYPWGPEWLDGVANTSESGIGRTTAVGCIPAGKACRAFATSPATSWSGAVTNTRSRRRSRSAPRIACCAVAPGASFRTTCLQTSINLLILGDATTIPAFGCRVRPVTTAMADSAAV
jgi:hypothetical protein